MASALIARSATASAEPAERHHLTVGTLPGTFPAAEFVQVFCARVRAAREARGMSRADMARKLEISRNAYGRYETRTLLPHHLAPEFAAITGAPAPGARTDLEPTGRRRSVDNPHQRGEVSRGVAVIGGWLGALSERPAQDRATDRQYPEHQRKTALRIGGGEFRWGDLYGSAPPPAATATETGLRRRRRHLDESQRAMVAAKIANLQVGDNQHAPIGATSQSDAADLLNVSRRAVQRAKAVLDGTRDRSGERSKSEH